MIDTIGVLYYVIASLVILGIGYAQGHITGSAIRHRFSLGRHFVRYLSIPVTVLFLLQAIIKINNMTNTENSTNIQTLTIDFSQLGNLVQSFMPNDTLDLISFAIPVGIVLLTIMAGITGFSRRFIMTVSVIAFAFMVSVKLGVQMGDDVMLWFILYQVGVSCGVLIGTGALRSLQRLSHHLHFPNL